MMQRWKVEIVACFLFILFSEIGCQKGDSVAGTAGIIQALANQSFGDTIFNGFPASRQDFRQDRADDGAVTRQEVTLIEANTALLINRTEQLQRQADENQSAIKAAIARINALTPGVNGTNGATGATGPAGLGEIGPIGSTGATGPTGTMGLMGPMGIMGSTGPIGLIGQAGSTGSTGSIGSPGTMGNTGPTGLTGQAGSGGAAGSIGPQGLIRKCR
ncbi:hypothetical protein CVIRNUC_010970 [Coccomyxa viridis]|uniref:Uncharacterized protein n=1 Tax=Coccomyxa viridis TaxID=1274662 RepID=A0AAV1IKH5_9CHLO|nr:hypothetical protein CVIRNUC_010970 [Coccomyxa viridis]